MLPYLMNGRDILNGSERYPEYRSTWNDGFCFPEEIATMMPGTPAAFDPNKIRRDPEHSRRNAAIVLTAAAAGLGWGIRGQYGHESGAMIAGALASVTMMIFFAGNAAPLSVVRAAAMATVAIGVGGSETYAQSVGLTHDPEVVGNWAAWRWGMLGLFIKGGLWIGYFGVFLGMGLSGKRYRPGEMLLLMLTLVGLVFLGIWLLNSPYDPDNRILPRIYFSDNWHFEPDNPNVKPRREIWGGLITALLTLTVYVGFVKKDRMAFGMAIFAFVAGGLGQVGGQCIQSYHSWNPDMIDDGWFANYPALKAINWWNMMETGFGCIFGALVALGVWLNRRFIGIEKQHDDVPFGPTLDTFLCVLHLVLLLTAEFLRIPISGSDRPIPFSTYTDYGLIMCVIPIVGICGGRFFPYLLMTIILAAPIMGKQMRELCYSGPADYPKYPTHLGDLIFVLIPSAVLLVVAAWLITSSFSGQSSRRMSGTILLVLTWVFFFLNTCFFGFAWPWKPLGEWTYRTPNQLVFMVFTAMLTCAAIRAICVRTDIRDSPQQKRLPASVDG